MCRCSAQVPKVLILLPNPKSVEMLENQSEFANVLWIIYEKSAMKFYIRDVNIILSDTKKLRAKLECMTTQINSLCNGTLE